MDDRPPRAQHASACRAPSATPATSPCKAHATYADTLYTTRNKVFRNECSETSSLDRLTSFTVRDIMFVGSESYVGPAARSPCSNWPSPFSTSSTSTPAIAAANDPFFTGDAMIKTVYQNAAELKQELLVTLPFNGRELAIGSVNLHQDFFGRCFDIAQSPTASRSGRDAWASASSAWSTRSTPSTASTPPTGPRTCARS